MTPFARWTLPRQPSMLAERMVRRLFSKTEGQTMILALAPSSSKVMNMTPLAEPGIWRTRIRPAMEMRRPLGASRKTGARRKAALSQALAQKGNRVRAQAQALAVVVFDDLAAPSHDRESHRGFG